MIVALNCPPGCLIRGAHEHVVLTPEDTAALERMVRGRHDHRALLREAVDRLETRGGVRFTSDGITYEVRVDPHGGPLRDEPVVTLDNLRLLATLDEVVL